MVLVQVRLQVVAHGDLRRGDKPDFDVLELAEQVGEGSDRAPVGEVADQRDAHAVDPAELVANRVQVEQRLRRVLAGPVPGVDHGDAADRGRAPGRALFAVAEHDHVRVSADDPDRVLERLALGGRRELARVVGPHGLAAQPKHRRLEGQAGSRRGFVEEGRHHLAGHAADKALGLALDLVSARDQVFEQGARELLTLDHVVQPRRDGHEKISFPGSLART